MSAISQFFSNTTNATNKKKNREIFVGPLGPFNWKVPKGVYEVEVHVWGGGGNGAFGGGGGGGYVRHLYPVSPDQVLTITVGSEGGGTSSVSCPSQTPSSPITATGGSSGGGAGLPAPGGSGGTGSFSIAPGISTAFTAAFSGGAGGGAAGTFPFTYGSGGAAGHPFGNGQNGSGGGAGANIAAKIPASSAGLGINDFTSLPANYIGNGAHFINAYNSYEEYQAAAIGITTAESKLNRQSFTGQWFYVDEIRGIRNPFSASLGAGVGGGLVVAAVNPGSGTFLGGGGGVQPGPGVPSFGGPGGLAGGAGGAPNAVFGGFGGAGVVILYW